MQTWNRMRLVELEQRVDEKMEKGGGIWNRSNKSEEAMQNLETLGRIHATNGTGVLQLGQQDGHCGDSGERGGEFWN